MPRLSLWRPNKGNDYKFFDRRMSEMFTVGGTDVHIHKYLGPISDGNDVSPTEPGYLNDSVKNIQDLLFLENRDRKYDHDVYQLRSIYRINDNDFDLTQFGLFLTGDTMFMVFHLNDMVETLGRKIMVGDVMELPHLKDYYPIDDDLPSALKRYYVVQDATRAAEGFAPTWYPHLWRVKVQPLVDSQEYKDLIDNIKAGENTDESIADVLSTYDQYTEINDAIVDRAEDEVPKSGYDTTFIYQAPVTADGYPGNPDGADASEVNVDASDADGTPDASSVKAEPIYPEVKGYLTENALPPNGTEVSSGIAFPGGSQVGDYFLRLDYKPNRLFRFDGKRWVKLEDNVRTTLTPGAESKTQRSSFMNNSQAYYTNALGWDAIKVSDPYTPEANAHTQTFTLSSLTVVTKTPYVSTYGARTMINGTEVTNTLSNSSGNIAITLTNTLTENDVLEYTVFANVTVQRQSLSDAFKPTADN